MVLAWIAGSLLGTMGGVVVRAPRASAQRAHMSWLPLPLDTRFAGSDAKPWLQGCRKYEQESYRCSPGAAASAAASAPAHRHPPDLLQLGINLLDRLQFTSKGKDYLHTIDYTADDDPNVPMPQTAGKPVR